MPSQPEELIPTRETLLSRLKDMGDEKSWQEFFETYWKLIYGTARKAGLPDDEAQDIVQETVISVAKNIEGFKYDPAICSFKSWMMQLTRWRIINQWKKRQRQQDRQFIAGSAANASLDESNGTPTLERIPDPAGLSLEAIWEDEWEKHLLHVAMERVKRQVAPEQLQVFDLYCVEQWPARKVARTLGVSVGQVYLAKHRVGRLLKSEIRILTRQLE